MKKGKNNNVSAQHTCIYVSRSELKCRKMVSSPAFAHSVLSQRLFVSQKYCLSFIVQVSHAVLFYFISTLVRVRMLAVYAFRFFSSHQMASIFLKVYQFEFSSGCVQSRKSHVNSFANEKFNSKAAGEIPTGPKRNNKERRQTTKPFKTRRKI